LSGVFPIENVPKQRDALPTLLLKSALDYTIKISKNIRIFDNE